MENALCYSYFFLGYIQAAPESSYQHRKSGLLSAFRWQRMRRRWRRRLLSLSGDLETFMPPPSSSQGGAAMSPVYSQLETALLAFPKVLRQTYV